MGEGANINVGKQSMEKHHLEPQFALKVLLRQKQQRIGGRGCKLRPQSKECVPRVSNGLDLPGSMERNKQDPNSKRVRIQVVWWSVGDSNP